MTRNTIGRLTAALSLSLLMATAQSATVFCPNGPNGALSAPTSGRYIQVTNAQNPGTCYYQQGNIQVSGQNNDMPAIATAAGVSSASLLLLTLNGTSGVAANSLSVTGSTAGSWSLLSGIWSNYSALYLGFHFGNGGGNPDSFVVQLESGQLGGAWSFNAVAPDAINGRSNFFLFGVANGNPPPTRVPEPGSLALAGIALLGVFAVRRRYGR